MSFTLYLHEAAVITTHAIFLIRSKMIECYNKCINSNISDTNNTNNDNKSNNNKNIKSDINITTNNNNNTKNNNNSNNQ